MKSVICRVLLLAFVLATFIAPVSAEVLCPKCVTICASANIATKASCQSACESGINDAYLRCVEKCRANYKTDLMYDIKNLACIQGCGKFYTIFTQ